MRKIALVLLLSLFASPALADYTDHMLGTSSTPGPAARTARGPLDIRTAPQMVADAARFVGTKNPYRFRGPGCKVFVNMIARRNGYYANSSARAVDVARMGTRVSYPQPGDYRYSSRSGGGHAELVADVRGSTVVTINGNKGGNRVGYSYRSIGSGAYYRPIRYASM